MGKQTWKAGNMLYPLPAVMVSVRGKNGEDNIITVAWAGTVCTNPPMVSISVRPERYSYQMIKESGAFVINLTTEDLCYATDYCGVRSGRDVDKFKEMKLTKVEAEEISAPMIGESPVNIECKVEQVLELGSHHMFLAKVVSTELLYYGSGAKEVIEKAFEDLPVNEVSCELKGVVSRKKQLIPAFMMALQNQ